MIRGEDYGFVDYNLNWIIPKPIQLPVQVGPEDSHKIKVKIFQLNKIYAFIESLDRSAPNYPYMQKPIYLPVMNDFVEYNREYVSRKDLSIVIKYIYAVLKETSPVLHPDAPVYDPGNEATSSTSTSDTAPLMQHQVPPMGSTPQGAVGGSTR